MLLATVFFVTFCAAPAYGQHPGEIGVDGGWTGFDNDITDANAWRVGFRAGVYVWNWIEIEGQVTGSRASKTVFFVSKSSRGSEPSSRKDIRRLERTLDVTGGVSWVFGER